MRNSTIFVTCLLFCFVSLRSFAQHDISLGTAGNQTYIHATDSVSFWGEVDHSDTLGLTSGSTLVFYGSEWYSQNKAAVISAGEFLMITPRPVPYLSEYPQYLKSASGKIALPILTVNNTQNVYFDEEVTINNELNFVTGKVVITNNNLIIDNSSSSAITGYTENRFIVTNGTGSLKRKGVGTTAIDFPVGQSLTSYTPARIENTGTVDDFSVRVISGVFDEGTSGVDVSNLGVGYTWDIEEGTSGGSDVTLYLQHNNSTEGANYDNSKAFISHYIGTAPNSAGDTTSGTKWDLVFSSNLKSGTSTGTITTGSAISGASVLSRSGVQSFSPFTKAGYNNAQPLPVELLSFDGAWQQNNVMLSWATASELNNSHFGVLRSSDGGVSYQEIGQITSLALNGNSHSMLNYNFIDVQAQTDASGLVLYKLLQFDYDGKSELFGPVDLHNNTKNTKALAKAYPNPTKEELTIELQNDVMNASISITNMVGVIVYDEKQINEFRSTISVAHLPSGVYFLNVRADKKYQQFKITVLR